MNPPKRAKFKKPAPVRQTLTSIYRMAKLNPLLQQESDDPKIKKTSLPPAVTGGRYVSIETSNSHSAPSITKSKAKQSTSCPKESSNARLRPKKPRRSLSAEHFQRKHNKLSRNEQMVKNAEMTQSLEDISAPPVEKRVTFMTPKGRQTDFHHFTSCVVLRSTPCCKDILRHLNHWLQRNGKSKNAYYHLKCFAVNPLVEEDEEEVMISPEIRDEIKTAQTLYAHRIENVIKDALDDLNHLTKAGYPLVQCEKWLAAIRQKYQDIEEQWQYWECRASIEQNRGNISSAVECYQTAIVKGAEVEHIEECLDQLLKKFVNVNAPIDGDFGDSKDVRTIFKTSIVQFALHKRNLKSREMRERITRRSTKF